MLVIRKEQMKVFQVGALRRFEDEMVLHAQEFAPELGKVLGDQQVRLVVRAATVRADGYGFTNRGSLRLFIELVFLFGSAFDTDPQYPWASAILRDSFDQMQKAERLYQKILDYQEKVSGSCAANTRAALWNLSLLPQQPLIFSTDNFVPGMLHEMEQIFPQKAAYLGEAALGALIRESYVAARIARFPTSRGYTMMLALMYAFGHGCVDDPLYPWITNTLKDEMIVDPGARADRLERKALTWLKHVLANTV